VRKQPNRPNEGEDNTKQNRLELFRKLQDPVTRHQFFERVSDDVVWTVMGTHPLAGTYHSKSEFQSATQDRLAPIMRDGIRHELQHVFVDGDVTVAELRSLTVTKEGAPFDNTYCWVCRFEGDTIVAVRAYVDSAMVAYTINRAERAARV
jgi:uncharacterized protein